MEYASNAKANTGVALGAVGTGLGILGSGMGLLGRPAFYGESGMGVNHHEISLLRELIDSKTTTAIMASENDTDKKLVEVYAALNRQDKEIRNDMEQLRREQEHINREQAVYNGINNASVTLLRNQVDQLMKLTVVKIPNYSICPGWGDVNVVPVTPDP